MSGTFSHDRRTVHPRSKLCLSCARQPYLNEVCLFCSSAGDHRHWAPAPGCDPALVVEILTRSFMERVEALEERMAAGEGELAALRRDVGPVLYPHHAGDYGQPHPPKPQARRGKAVAVKGVTVVRD